MLSATQWVSTAIFSISVRLPRSSSSTFFFVSGSAPKLL